ncbi:MAG: hypothetical protein ABSG99_02820 [Sedimentisphaerales bacterium]
MKKLMLVMMLFMVMVVVAGCATQNMHVKKTLADGSSLEYDVKLGSALQDIKGTDLAASLDPEGKTTVKAGAIDSSTSPVAVEAIKQFGDIAKIAMQAALAAKGVPVPAP